MRQGDLFEGYERTPAPAGREDSDETFTPDLEHIRAKLNTALEELRAADSFPWTEKDLHIWRLLFRQMPNWLPEQERTEIQQAFLRELDRWGRRDE